MKNYRFAITALLAAACLSVACEEDILRDVDECYITLDAENTYTVGKEVKFNIKGNPDYIYFFSGETGHKYEYRDRTTIALEDLETCKLVVDCNALYGNPKGLALYVSKTFEGLKGNDAAADLATMQAIEASMDENGEIPGWDRLPYEDVASSRRTVEEYDITDYADSFCLMFHWHPVIQDKSQIQRTYRIIYSLRTKFRGYDEVTTKGTALGMTSVCMNIGEIAATSKKIIEDAYFKNDGDGSVRFDDKVHDINFAGVAGNKLDYTLNSWVLTKPQPLNHVSPDEGLSVKAVADDIYQYGYVYEKPGTYEATFVITNGNYQGTERKIQKMTVNVIAPIAAGGEPEVAPAE